MSQASTERFKLNPPNKPIKGSISVPGSKSYTNRALLIASITPGLSRLKCPSLSNDSIGMIEALSRFGVAVHRSLHKLAGEPDLIVEGRGGHFLPARGEIDVGPAGTTMRFIVALASIANGADVVIKGTERMHQRPISELVDALTVLGADIKYLGNEGCPPLHIHGTRPNKVQSIRMKGSQSSQFLSAMLLISPLFKEGLEITIVGDQTSKSYIDMTIQSMQDFGVKVENDGYKRYTIAKGQCYKPRSYTVEGDASGASYFWGLAAISGGEVTVENINPASAQGDVHFPELLKKMGCRISNTDKSITVCGPEKLKAIDIDMSLMPDTAQTLAVVAALADGTTTIRGLHTLKEKETDRLLALKTELSKMGIKSEITADSIAVTGGTPRTATIDTYEDHRMAMSFAMLGAVVPGVVINEPSVVQKSYPDFWQALTTLGVEVQ